MNSPPGPACLLCERSCKVLHRFANGFAVFYCGGCQLGSLDPLPDPQNATRLYESKAYFEGEDDLGYSSYLKEKDTYLRTFRAKIAELLEHGSIRRLLEIGCGPGFLLEACRELGVERAVGVDLNPWAIELAQRRGLEARVGGIESIPPRERFDAVAMLDLIEHVADPWRFLAEVRTRLDRGGRILLMTPNIRSWLARVSGPRWVSYKLPEHVRYYSPRSMRMLLERCGFEPLAIHAAGQYATVDFLTRRLGWLAPRPFGWLRPSLRALGLASTVVFAPNGSIDVVARRSGRDSI